VKKVIDKPDLVPYKGQGFSLEQSDDFARWLKKLRDRDGRLRIIKRLRRLSDGQFGDCQSVGVGVHELRMFFGPGYRVYFIQQGDTVIVLLAGGDKDSQASDIARAKALAKEFGFGNEDDPL
jgi:putative addiction module killer protein